MRNNTTENNASLVLSRVAVELFQFTEELGMLMAEIAFTPYGKLRINRIPRSTYYHKLRKFEKHGLVKKVKKPSGHVFILSPKAKQLRKRPVVKMDRKDGMSTIVMFDIPEEKHNVRDSFRRYLIRNGYTQIKESAFISPFKASAEMLDFIKELKISSNVTFISGKVDYLISL